MTDKPSSIETPSVLRRYLHDEKAANFHDIWKHFILVEYVRLRANFPMRKITYIDTHAGSFAYRNSNEIQLRSGILNFTSGFDSLPECTYKNIINIYGSKITKDGDNITTYYPGSLAFSSWLLRHNRNKIIGCDINSDMIKKCEKQALLFKKTLKSRIQYDFFIEDGYGVAEEYIKTNREENGLVFIDPPYYPDEKTDWNKSLNLVNIINEVPRWSLVQWYCVYTDDTRSCLGYLNNTMEVLKNNAKFLSAINISLQVRPLSKEYAKTISGILIVNPVIDVSKFSSALIKSGIKEIGDSLSPIDVKWGPKIDIEFIG
ncbi:hypothetical protein KL86SPO_50095 [uncultured Sporomusa sp.]|uniref:Uncharacterized protein n=1 Tax=uncultured Sporomusa sp. TaxID=307249 RepID=A0A212LXF8_9FIRM|nr:23S rRNA (adenine(2030)-N(6))-methyltransferase RlmJ [uncultured Sporomusa sp.]SCM82324.1 hypothetical protein KL86SPO_50095 [uncultured Sporomusa sp.]